MTLFSWRYWGLDKRDYPPREKVRALGMMGATVLLLWITLILPRLVDYVSEIKQWRWFIPDSSFVQLSTLVILGLISVVIFYRLWQHRQQQGNLYQVAFIQGCFIGCSSLLIAMLLIDFFTLQNYASISDQSMGPLLLRYLHQFRYVYILLLTLIVGLHAYGQWLKHQYANLHKKVDETTKNFGSAELADKAYLKANDFYDEQDTLLGKDNDNHFLHYPLCNRTIVSSTGGGKTAGLIIPTLLTENRPVIVHDVKGELWAVTAKHRADAFSRDVVAIDPFNILQDKLFQQDKSTTMCRPFTINPLDYIPDDIRFRDRAITTLGKSLVVSEGHVQMDSHWNENAKILLGGLIAYIMQYSEEKSLLVLHDLLSRDAKETNTLLQHMTTLEDCPRASASAAQILKAAPEERGSIYTTTYRQIQWLVDSNMRHTFEKSNFDLKDFLNGKMDIYVVIPADQVKSQSRVIRMIFSTITSMLIQSPPDQLPRQKVLTIFDELGQLGYNDDVEWALEVIRAYGVVNWCVFQDVDQIELYKKPNLFKNTKVKQFFEIDDPKTMEWIQKLGGKRTILTENISKNQGTSSNSNQLFNKNSSQGEGRSVHETGVDLIHFNEIRELPYHQQYVFVRGHRAIKCQKVFYYQEPYFKGLYEQNPLEFERS